MGTFDLAQDLALVLGVALAGGMAARMLKLPVLLGYVLAGIFIGPFGLGLVKDRESIDSLANIGIVLLMFAIGTQFPLREMWRGGAITFLGGSLQILLSALLGLAFIWAAGWPVGQGFLFGLLIAQSSTAVILKTLMDRDEVESPHGRIVIGMSVFQDITTVPLLVLIYALGEAGAGPWGVAEALGLATLKAAGFLAGILIIGLGAIPWLLNRIFSMGSRELRLLAILALSVGIALGTYAFGLSPALGAFVAGLIISESDFALEALADVAPVRDLLLILFFVSVGMLIAPTFVSQNLILVAYLVPAILAMKFLVAAGIVRAAGYPGNMAIFVGLGLIPVSEFTFILGKVALDQGLISADIYSLTLTTALATILLGPPLLTGVAYFQRRGPHAPEPAQAGPRQWLRDHVVICGHGPIGRHLAEAMERQRLPYLVVDTDPKVIAHLRSRGVPYVYGDASNPEVLAKTQLAAARLLVLTYSDPMATELVMRHAQRINPKLDVASRVYPDSDLGLFRSMGSSQLLRMEREQAQDLIRYTFHKLGMSTVEIKHILAGLSPAPQSWAPKGQARDPKRGRQAPAKGSHEKGATLGRGETRNSWR